MPPSARVTTDAVVLGGGQAGLAVAFWLRRARPAVRVVVLDEQAAPGGAWRHGWDSLRLFSPAEASSLPGWPLPRAQDSRYPAGDAPEYPSRDDVSAYLAAYQARYAIPVERPVRAVAVHRDAEHLVVETDRGAIAARAVVSATGTWAAPWIPDVPGRLAFAGVQVHSAHYRRPDALKGRRVLFVGGGNSGAQIAAEVSAVASIAWATDGEPRLLPVTVDGRVLFEQASAAYAAMQAGEARPYGLGDIVQTAPVRAALAAGRLADRRPPPVRLTAGGAVWPDGREEAFDAIVWCTGFRPALAPLAPLGVVGPDGRVAVEGTRSVAEPRLWLVGYGGWTGFASATLVGVGRSARATAAEVAASLQPSA